MGAAKLQYGPDSRLPKLRNALPEGDVQNTQSQCSNDTGESCPRVPLSESEVDLHCMILSGLRYAQVLAEIGAVGLEQTT